MRNWLAVAAVITAVSLTILPDPSSAQPQRTAAQTAEQGRLLSAGLKAQLTARCPAGTEEAMLTTISERTAAVDIEVIAAAFALLAQDTELCASARAAIASANQAAQLALASSGATGGTGAPANALGAPFATGNVGAPGGGGGSSYTPG